MNVLSDFASKFKYEVYACEHDKKIIKKLYGDMKIEDKYRKVYELRNVQLANIWINHLNIINIDYE